MSIFNKVKSRLSSILSNSISKWFSPSSNLQNDSLNGSAGSVVNVPRRQRHTEVKDDAQVDNSIGEDGDDEDSPNSEDDCNASVGVQKLDQDIHFDGQPPEKRPRLCFRMSDSSTHIAARKPIIASTTSLGRMRNRSSFAGEHSMAPRSLYQRFSNLNLYSNLDKKEPAYNFDQFRSIDKISTNKRSENKSEVHTQPGISSPRNVDIPSTSAFTRVGRIMPQLEGQPLSTSTDEWFTPTQACASCAACAPPRCTPSTINDIKSSEEQSHHGKNDQKLPTTQYNGQIVSETSNLCRKTLGEHKHLNESWHNFPNISESGTSQVYPKIPSPTQKNRKAEFLNTNVSVAGSGTATTTGNNRRKMELNFYSHLEGRKSLFNASSGHGNSKANQFNNPTLSRFKFSRNCRQFNPFLYGSTSALTGRRLLNTYSPFYKGRTTYGGAAAYRKYNSGASASSVRITPTLIRPTSSLSTLSSSASSGRFNEYEHYSSRAMRLAQVTSPYQRHMVVLQPIDNANTLSSGDGTGGGPLPPTRELQVPTISQLLERKKIQTVTEKIRNTRDAVANNQQKFEYSLPAADDNLKAAKNLMNRDVVVAADPQQQEQKHTNEIINKVDEAPPPPPSLNLPSLVFPKMQSLPKFDINFSPVPETAPLIPTSATGLEKTETMNLATTSTANKSTTSPLHPTTLENKSSNTCSFGCKSKSSIKNFKFSEPIKVEGGRKEAVNDIPTKKQQNYKFSPPWPVTYSANTPNLN